MYFACTVCYMYILEHAMHNDSSGAVTGNYFTTDLSLSFVWNWISTAYLSPSM